jgi:hypothetical protein
MFTISEEVVLKQLEQGGQLYWAFPFGKGSPVSGRSIMDTSKRYSLNCDLKGHKKPKSDSKSFNLIHDKTLNHTPDCKKFFKKFLLVSNHRHLSKIDCLMACNACFVCFISTVNGHSKKKKKKRLKMWR